MTNDTRIALPKWKSHKIVEAAEITRIERDLTKDEVRLVLNISTDAQGEPITLVRAATSRYVDQHNLKVGGYFVQYANHYLSFCLAEQFLKEHIKLDSPVGQVPRWQSNKIVEAAKILFVEGISEPETEEGYFLRLTLQLPSGSTVLVRVESGYNKKHSPAPNGYYVRYSDGYQSYSPDFEFEPNYTLCDDPEDTASIKVAQDTTTITMTPDSTPETQVLTPRRIQAGSPPPKKGYPFSAAQPDPVLATEKVMDIASIEQAKAAIPDIKVVGDGDLFKVLCKASSASAGWMKSSKSMEIPGVGCVVQVTTQQRNPDGSYAVAEAVTFVPNTIIADDVNGGRKLLPMVSAPVNSVGSASGSVGTTSDESADDSAQDFSSAAHALVFSSTAGVERKPPLGLRPAHLVRASRIEEIKAAIYRFEVAGVPIPKVWAVELRDLTLDSSMPIPPYLDPYLDLYTTR